MGNTRILQSSKSQTTKAATKELLLEQIGKTDAVLVTASFVIALPSGEADPTPDPLPDA